MSINTDSSAGKAAAGRLGLNKKTKHVQLRYLYMQDIVQRREMTISKIPTTDNPADALTKHLPSTTITSHLARLHLQTTMTSTIGSLLGGPTTTRLTIGMIDVVNNEQQPATVAVEARLGLCLSQAQQFRRRRRRNSLETPRRRRQQQPLEQQPEQRAVQQCDTVVLARRQSTITLPRYFGSTISPLATARDFIVDLGAMAGIAGDFTMINGHMSEETMSQLQQPRLKASSTPSTRAIPSTMPTMEHTIPMLTATANPVSPPDNRPTSSTTPMGNDATAAAGEDHSSDVTLLLRAESISSRTISLVTVSSETMVTLSSLFGNNLVTKECAPMVRYLLDDADFYPTNTMTATDKIKGFATIGNIRPIERDSFIPAQWDNNQEQHRWWTWLTEAQMEQYIQHGTVPGFKEVHGDNVHRHGATTGSTIMLITIPISQYIADGTVGTGQCTEETSQLRSWFGDNLWHTSDVLQWPMG
eukprot:5701818-Amphidinium_carterae.1